MKAAGGFLKSAACLAALGKALQSNTTLTYLEISYNAELDVRWEGADAAHAQDPDDPTSGLALLCAGIAAHPTLRSLHMLGAATIQATSGTQVRDNGPRLATAVLANPNIEIFGEVPIGALRSDAIKGELALKDGRMGCAEGYVLTKLLESGAGASLEILTLVDIYYTTEVYNTLGSDKDACVALREACKKHSPKEIKFRTSESYRPDDYPK